MTPRTVVVTGAGSGLGAALTRHFAGDADTNVVAADVDGERLDALVAELAGVPGEVVAVPTDVGDPAAVTALVTTAVDRFGSLDVMINNAGILGTSARMHKLTPADWEHVVRVNLMGVVNGITAAVRVMRPQGGGSIVSTASIAGLVAFPYSAPYNATKAAVIQLTKVAAVEYARDGIRVNCVCPGAFRSNMQGDLTDDSIAHMQQRQPLGIGEPDGLVGAYAYLAGDASRWTTGSAMVVDGGYTAH